MKTSKNMTLEETIVLSCAHCYILLVNFRPTIGKSSLRFSSLAINFSWRILELRLRLHIYCKKDYVSFTWIN